MAAIEASMIWEERGFVGKLEYLLALFSRLGQLKVASTEDDFDAILRQVQKEAGIMTTWVRALL
jgi:hypothetical protein